MGLALISAQHLIARQCSLSWALGLTLLRPIHRLLVRLTARFLLRPIPSSLFRLAPRYLFRLFPRCLSWQAGVLIAAGTRPLP